MSTDDTANSVAETSDRSETIRAAIIGPECGWPLPHRNVLHDGKGCTTCTCARAQGHRGKHACSAEILSEIITGQP